MANRSNRRAAVIATLIAVPIALLVAAISFGYLASRTNQASPSASPTVAANTSTGPVTMPAPKLSAAHAQACLAFIAQLPTQLRNLPERHVNAPEQNAAFGDPPITVQCGAAEARPAPTDQVYPISGVCWFA